MIAAEVTLKLADSLTLVAVRRNASVTDDFWLSVWAEWGMSGPEPNVEVHVPLDQFICNTGWFPQACAVHGVRPLLGSGVRGILERRQAAGRDLKSLQHTVGEGRPPDSQPVHTSRFVRDLREFQRRDFNRLASMANGANFSVPGAGKTAVTLALYERERCRGRVDRLLVVAPISAFEAWGEEASLCFEPPLAIAQLSAQAIPRWCEVLVVNYQRLASRREHLAAWLRSHRVMLVLDEAHRIKRGWQGQWGSDCLRLAPLAERRDVLTGTPAPNAVSDIDSLLDFLWLGQASGYSASLSSAGADGVGDRLKPLFARTTKGELDLPPVDFRVVKVPPTPLQAAIYDTLRRKLQSDFDISPDDRRNFTKMGRVVMYLLQAASNPKLLPIGASPTDAFQYPPLPLVPGTRLYDLVAEYLSYEVPSKFAQLFKLVENNARVSRKTLVWSNFVGNLELLRRQLAIYEPAVVHGSIPAASWTETAAAGRQAEIDRFRHSPECLVLLANPAALSEGVSLHRECHHAVYLDRTFNAGHYLQSIDRIHRLGLAPGESTSVTLLVTEGTVDEVVDSRIRLKATALGRLLDDPSIERLSLPDDEDYGSAIEGSDDIAALLSHLSGSNLGGGRE